MNNGTIEKAKSGAGTPELRTIKIKPKPINNLTFITAKINDKIQERAKEYIQEGIKNGYNIILFHVKNGELTKIPEWFGMKATDEEGKKYKADADKLLLALSKKPYGYGVLAGEQPGGRVFISIDVDIDTEECKERLSKEIEEQLTKLGIKYYKEITKSERIHYYIILDKTTDKIESITKLPYPGTCSKFKDGEETKGEIELLTKKPVVVYDGIINDKEPFFTQKPEINSYIAFENFLEEWISKYKPVESKKEPKEEPKKEDKSLIQFSKIVEAYKIIRQHRIINGWEIDKVFSSYCIINNVPEEEIIEGFKTIYGLDYDEKITANLLRLTRKKDKNLLPGIGSVYYHINIALNTEGLSEYEKELLNSVKEELRANIPYDYILPEYLKNAENVILYDSLPYSNKDGRVYYKENYFIEQNINGIKKVIYVSITASEKYAIYKHHKLDKIKEVGIKADIIRLVKDGKIEAYEYLINDKVIYKPSFDYSKIDDIIHEIELIGMKYTTVFDVNLYKRYLSKKIENYIKENGEPIPCVVGKTTGWSEDLRFFYHYGLNDKYHELHQEHILYKYHKDLIKKKDKQHEIVKALLQEGKLLAVLLTASASSILIKPFNLPGITYIVAGNSGAGKTTSSLIATSLFYYSDDVLMNAQTTKTGLELTISSLNSLPVLIDEGALAGVNLSLNDLVFMVSSGKGKTRGRKDLSVDFKELKSNVFWTTEATDIDELRRTGAFRRMMYLLVNSWNDLTSLFKPEDRINEQYAGCGIDYIQYLIEHMEEVKKAFKEEAQGLNPKYKEITTIALNLYSGLTLLEAFYNTRFYELRKTINKLLNEAKTRFIDSKDNVVIQLRDYLESITYQRFHVINDGTGIDKKITHNEVYGEYDKSEGIYYITAKGFKEIAKEMGRERQLLVNELEKAKVLIAKNVSYYTKATGQTIKVYKIKFSEIVEPEPIETELMELETVEPETVETKAMETEPIKTEAVEPKTVEPEPIEPEAVETEEEESFEEIYIHDYVKRYKENPNEAVKFKESVKKYIKSGEAGELLKTVRKIRHDDVDIIQQAREQGLDVKENSLISYVISDYKAKKYCFGVYGWNYDKDYYLDLVDKLTEEATKRINGFR
ncbi:MAG: DUF927 domain-containing protein [Sulfurihydrogenibium sp.]|nr:DUF927 domain-containing protein [Sulfurihydrogenibium sp.]